MWDQILRGQLARMVMRAADVARPCAGPKCFVDDGLDGARATAAFGAATEAAVHLLGIAREVFSHAHRTADIVIGKNVAGADNHGNAGALR